MKAPRKSGETNLESDWRV